MNSIGTRVLFLMLSQLLLFCCHWRKMPPKLALLGLAGALHLSPLSGRSCFLSYPTNTEVTISKRIISTKKPYDKTPNYPTSTFKATETTKEKLISLPNANPAHIGSTENHTRSQRTSTFLPSDSHQPQTASSSHLKNVITHEEL